MDTTSRRVIFEQDDYDFIMEYKQAFGLDFQKFVRKAVKKEIANIKLSEELSSLNRIKEK